MGNLPDLDVFDCGQIDGKRVAWCDESRFRLLNANGRLRIRHQAHEVTDPYMPGWNCTRARWLNHGLGCFFVALFGISVFQQDNCTSHKSRLATDWLGKHSSDVSAINWSPRSQELNPMEHVLDVLVQGVKGHHTAPMILAEL
ncbi:DDE_3 domain-containing protein [Trichonephila clavipes]|nr:DDE_3 domain-containing protein [Trichonephila clavipes]